MSRTVAIDKILAKRWEVFLWQIPAQRLVVNTCETHPKWPRWGSELVDKSNNFISWICNLALILALIHHKLITTMIIPMKNPTMHIDVHKWTTTGDEDSACWLSWNSEGWDPCIPRNMQLTTWDLFHMAANQRLKQMETTYPYKWVTGVVTLLVGVITPFIIGRGPPCSLWLNHPFPGKKNTIFETTN